jgi:hypothetical protein
LLKVLGTWLAFGLAEVVFGAVLQDMPPVHEDHAVADGALFHNICIMVMPSMAGGLGYKAASTFALWVRSGW